MSYQTPRGTYDILPDETSAWQKMEEMIREVCRLYRYSEIRTPVFEDTKVFKRENDSSDMVNKEMYTFVMNHDSYTLRPEGTAGVIRAFDQHKFYGGHELPLRLYYMGPMFRHERPQKGRQRQFTQFGVENIGVSSPEIDAETIALGCSIVRRMGISSVKVCLNTLGDDASRTAYRAALKEYFTPHIDALCPDCRRRLEQNPLRILDCKADAGSPILSGAPRLSDYLNEESREYFEKMLQALDALGIEYEIDERLVRGLDYYTHTVFEVKSTRPDSGAQATVFAGGRYDHLVEYFGGPKMSGMGFAIGLERLLALAKEEGWQEENRQDAQVYVISIGETGCVPLSIAETLRNENISAEVCLLKRSLKAQFKSAERSKARVIIIAGESELQEGAVNVKDTVRNEQTAVKLEELSEKVKEILGK